MAAIARDLRRGERVQEREGRLEPGLNRNRRDDPERGQDRHGLVQKAAERRRHVLLSMARVSPAGRFVAGQSIDIASAASGRRAATGKRA